MSAALMPRKWRKAAFEDDDDVYGDYDDDYEYEEEEYGDDQAATSTSGTLSSHAPTHKVCLHRLNFSSYAAADNPSIGFEVLQQP